MSTDNSSFCLSSHRPLVLGRRLCAMGERRTNGGRWGLVSMAHGGGVLHELYSVRVWREGFWTQLHQSNTRKWRKIMRSTLPLFFFLIHAEINKAILPSIDQSIDQIIEIYKTNQSINRSTNANLSNQSINASAEHQILCLNPYEEDPICFLFVGQA